MTNKTKGTCPCCSGKVIVEHLPAKWQGEKDSIRITHVKWDKK